MMSYASTSMNGIENDNHRHREQQPPSFPRPPPYRGGYCYSYYHGEHVATRVIHMDGDVAHCDSDDTDENVISTTILVHNPTTSTYSKNDSRDVLNRRFSLVSPPPGFHHVKPKMEVNKYDCVIRERRGTPCWQQQRQPLSCGSLWDSMKRSHQLSQMMMQQEDNGSGSPCWMMMGLVQYPIDTVGGGGGGRAGPKLEFWFVQGTSKISRASITAAIMVRLDGRNMIRKVHSVVAAAAAAAANANTGKGEQRPKKKQFWVHLIDANVFVAQDSDQVVLAIEKLLETYGPRLRPQGVEDSNNVIERPVHVTGAAPDTNGGENPSEQQSWPGENYNVNVHGSDDISDDLTQETVSSLQDEEDDNDSGIDDMNNDTNFPRGRQLQQQRRRRRRMSLDQSRRRLFHRTTTSTSTPADAATGGGGRQHPRGGGRFWTAFSRGAPVRARNGTLIDV